MRSLQHLIVSSAIGAACAFVSWPAHANTSTWDHNGSQVVLEENGKQRKIVYSEPRGALDTAGVRKGTVLFDGEAKADGRLAGYAKLFRAGCDPVDYFVEGSLDTSKGEILLQGQAPIYSGQGCKITGYSDDNTASTLTFRQQGGNYASRIEQVQPDADAGSASPYAPRDGWASQDDPASVDPRDPRYGSQRERGLFDPREPLPRYSERDYPDRRRLDPRNDGYNNPDDPAGIFSDDEEEEDPPYRPYRPFWRWGN